MNVISKNENVFHGRWGLLFLNIGSPNSLDDIPAFMYNIFSDREIIKFPGGRFLHNLLSRMIVKLRTRKIQESYRLIGGKSPLLEITRAQAEGVKEKFRSQLEDLEVYVGMRYWNPTAAEAVKKCINDKRENVVAIPLYPHYSMTTTGSIFRELDRIIRQLSPQINFIRIENFHIYPGYIQAWAEKLRDWRAGFTGKAHLLFSAHGIPMSFVNKGDPYPRQIEETAEEIVRKADWIEDWSISYQSRSGPIRWLKPNTCEVVEELARKKTNIVILPISFVSENFETLYEIDILYKEIARKSGALSFHRLLCLNTNQLFIESLCDLIIENIRKNNPA